MELNEQAQSTMEIGRVIGKREMLYYLQRATIAAGGTLTLEQINQYSQTIAIEEHIWEVDKHDDGVQSDMRVSSIAIAESTV